MKVLIWAFQSAKQLSVFDKVVKIKIQKAFQNKSKSRL
jgi:hypothetical protein